MALKYPINDPSIELSSVYYQRGFANYKIEAYSNAMTDLNKAIDIKPNNPKAYIIKARIQNKTGDKDGYCITLKKASDLGDVNSKKLYEENCK